MGLKMTDVTSGPRRADEDGRVWQITARRSTPILPVTCPADGACAASRWAAG
jgi:hypothetical protein